MSSNIQYARMFQKRDKTENWTESNFKPGPGEIIVYEKDENINRPRIRIGAENTNLSDLPFLTGEVYSQKEQPPIDAAEGAIWINEDAPLNELLTNAGAGKVMAVNITVDQNQLKADKTYYDIKASLEIGYFIYAIITFKSNGQTLYQKYATLSNYKADQYIEFTTWLPGKGATKVVQLKYRYGDEVNGEVLPEIPELENFYAFIARTENGEIELYYTTGEVAKNTDDTLYMFARENLNYIHYILLNDTWEKVQASTCEAGEPLSETILTPFWTNHEIKQTGDDTFLEASNPDPQPEESDDIVFTTENQSVSCKILASDKLELIYSSGGGGGANWDANTEQEDGYVQGRPIWNQKANYDFNTSLSQEVEDGVFYISDFAPDYQNMSSIQISIEFDEENFSGTFNWPIVGYFTSIKEFDQKITELGAEASNKIYVLNGVPFGYLSDCYVFVDSNKNVLCEIISSNYEKIDEEKVKGIYIRKIQNDNYNRQITKLSFEYQEIQIDQKYSKFFKKKEASNVFTLNLNLNEIMSGEAQYDKIVALLLAELNRFDTGDIILIPAALLQGISEG